MIDCKLLVPASADPRIYLWQGDITTLRCDAIINAANSTLLGCWRPCHKISAISLSQDLVNCDLSKFAVSLYI